MTAPTFLSVFSGIGGFDLGLEQAGWECVGHIENNAFCNRVLERHWPAVPRWGDITQLDPDDLPDCDLLVGGFPCTDVSVAGRRAGLAGEQSGLFFEFVRLAAALCPTWLLIENVPGLFSSNKGRDFATILAALGDIGYGVAWRVLDSRYFGVAQRRRRVFLVGHLGGPCPAAVLFESEGVRGDSPAGRTTWASIANGTANGTGSHSSTGSNGTIQAGEVAPGSEGVAGTLGSARGRGWCDDFERSGAFVVEEAKAFAWQQGDDSKFNANGRGRSWITRAGDCTGSLPGTRQDAVAYSLTTAQRRLGSSQDQNYVVAGTQGASNNRHPAGTKAEADLVVPVETTPLYYSHGYNQDRIYSQNGLAPAVCAQDNAGARRFLTCSGVRRLTPTECARLQAFPDGWTCLCGATPYSTWDCACPDAPRYAALGNAVTTSVARWIGARLLAVHHALGY